MSTTTPRRRVLRPTPAVSESDARRMAQLHRKRTQLETQRAALARWMTKLKRAFHSVERIQARAARLERQIASLNDS